MNQSVLIKIDKLIEEAQELLQESEPTEEVKTDTKEEPIKSYKELA